MSSMRISTKTGSYSMGVYMLVYSKDINNYTQNLNCVYGGIMYMTSRYLDHKPQAKLMHSENPPN